MATGRRLRTQLGQLELYTEAAPGKATNEDVVDAEGPAAWLLDAAGASDDPEACTEHDASWYANQLSAAIRDGLAISLNRVLASVLADAIAAVTQTHHRLCPQVPRGHGPSATVAIVHRHDDQLHYLVLGDSTLLVETNDGTLHHHNDRRLGNVAIELRAEILESIRAGRGYEGHYRTKLADLRVQERAVRNTQSGFWIASDNPEAASHALTGTYPINDEPAAARRLGLVSDGLGRAVTHLKLYYDWRNLLASLFDRGIAGCVAEVRDTERRDPAGRTLPRTKPADDASAITCTL